MTWLKNRRTALELETLSARDMPSITLASGVITATGDASNDWVTVTRNTKGTASVYDDTITVLRQYGAYGDPASVLFNPYSEVKTYNMYSPPILGVHIPLVTKVVANLKDGFNEFTNSTSVKSVVTGGKDADKFQGGSGDDWFDGKGGNDKLYGKSGNDYLSGGAGTDYLYGESGTDTLVSVDGNTDTVSGGGEVDTFWADQSALDSITDLSLVELWGGRAHRIAAFSDLAHMETGQQGDVTWADIFYTPVGKTPNGPNLLDPVPASNDINAGNFKDRPLFGHNGPQLDDIDQNRIPDCWLLAALGGVAAKSPETIRQAVTELGDGTYAVRFYRNGQAVYYRVDADLVESQRVPC